MEIFLFVTRSVQAVEAVWILVSDASDTELSTEDNHNYGESSLSALFANSDTMAPNTPNKQRHADFTRAVYCYMMCFKLSNHLMNSLIVSRISDWPRPL